MGWGWVLRAQEKKIFLLLVQWPEQSPLWPAKVQRCICRESLTALCDAICPLLRIWLLKILSKHDHDFFFSPKVSNLLKFTTPDLGRLLSKWQKSYPWHNGHPLLSNRWSKTWGALMFHRGMDTLFFVLFLSFFFKCWHRGVCNACVCVYSLSPNSQKWLNHCGWRFSHPHTHNEI